MSRNYFLSSKVMDRGGKMGVQKCSLDRDENTLG